MSNQLFNGQTNHALSHEELTELCAQTTLFCTKEELPEESRKLHDAFRCLNSTPTGRETLRHMLNSNDRFHYSLNGRVEIPRGAAGVYRQSRIQDRISILPNYFDDPEDEDRKKYGAICIAHESVHDMQNAEVKCNQQAMDAETQALDQQLETELNMPEDSDTCPNYRGVYNNNYNKWLRIAQNPETTPRWALRFEPLPGVNVEDARKAYAAQMASQETRATFVHDFVRLGHIDETKANPPIVFNDTATRKTVDAYITRSQIGDTRKLDEETIRNFQSRNPFINRECFNPLREDLGLSPLTQQDGDKDNQPQLDVNTALAQTGAENITQQTNRTQNTTPIQQNNQTQIG